MEREKEYPEVLQKARGVTIVRLDENRIELRTVISGWRDYLQIAFVFGICAVLFFGLVFKMLSALSLSDSPPGSVTFAVIGVILMTGLVLLIMRWVLYHTLPQSFLMNTKSRKCFYTYLRFFRREIPFEDVEYIEEDGNHNGVGFFLKEKGRQWRTCIFFANGFTKSMGAPEASVRIFTREFEKAGITFVKSKEDSK